MMDALDVLALLRQRCEEAGGQAAFARLHNVHLSDLGNVASGYRLPSNSVLIALGLRKVTGYLPVKPVARAAE